MISNENNQEATVAPEATEGEGGAESETITLSKSEYEKLNQTLGSYKRELKDLKKPKEETKETSKTNQKPEENALLQRLESMSLRQAGLTHQDDIELARSVAKKWGMDIEEVLVDEDFKVKLERQQTTRSNAVATSNIRGGQGTSQAKNTPEYWIAKGAPPTVADVPDRKTRAKIARAMMDSTKNTKKFYND